jgi:hypothetical protein
MDLACVRLSSRWSSHNTVLAAGGFRNLGPIGSHDDLAPIHFCIVEHVDGVLCRRGVREVHDCVAQRFACVAIITNLRSTDSSRGVELRAGRCLPRKIENSAGSGVAATQTAASS